MLADIFTTLLQAAIYKRAAIMEQWLVQHSHCDPKPQFEISDDYIISIGRCSCGTLFHASLSIDVFTKEFAK